jgi:Xaa-Pro aminopeptidase
LPPDFCAALDTTAGASSEKRTNEKSVPNNPVFHLTPTLYRQRRVKLAAKLHGGSAVIFAAHEPPMEYQDYRQDEDFFYLTGSNEPGGALLLIGDGPATTTRLGTVVPAHSFREVLFLPMRDPIREKYTGAKTDAASPGARELLGVDEVMPFSALPQVFGGFLAEDLRRAREVWSQQDTDVAHATLGFISTVLGTDITPPTQDVRSLTTQLRMVKSSAEIALIQKGNRCFDRVAAGRHASHQTGSK